MPICEKILESGVDDYLMCGNLAIALVDGDINGNGYKSGFLCADCFAYVGKNTYEILLDFRDEEENLDEDEEETDEKEISKE